MGSHSHILLGKAIAELAAGRPAKLIRRRDDGKIFENDALRAVSRDFVKEEVQVLEYSGRRVLDLRCGAGRLLKKLSERQKTLMGIDVSPEAVEACRHAGFDALEGDLWAPPFEGKFDTVLLFDGQMGIGGSEQGTKRLLDHLTTLLTDRGVIVGTYYDRTEEEAADDKAYFARLKSLGRGSGQAAFRYEYAGQIGEPFLLWCPTMDELTAITGECGYGIDFVQLTGGSNECYTVLTRI